MNRHWQTSVSKPPHHCACKGFERQEVEDFGLLCHPRCLCHRRLVHPQHCHGGHAAGPFSQEQLYLRTLRRRCRVLTCASLVGIFLVHVSINIAIFVTSTTLATFATFAC
jgi:hypothetical protein